MDRPIWYVYGLIAPEDNWVFYVGITTNLKKRLGQHMTNRDSAAYEACRQILRQGDIPRMCCFMGTYDKDAALQLERHLIIGIPQTYNRTFFKEGFKFWESTRDRMFAKYTADEMVEMGHGRKAEGKQP